MCACLDDLRDSGPGTSSLGPWSNLLEPLGELEGEQLTEQAADTHAGVIIAVAPCSFRPEWRSRLCYAGQRGAVLFRFIISINGTIQGQFHEGRKGDGASLFYLVGNFFSHFVHRPGCGAELATAIGTCPESFRDR